MFSLFLGSAISAARSDKSEQEAEGGKKLPEGGVGKRRWESEFSSRGKDNVIEVTGGKR